MKKLLLLLVLLLTGCASLQLSTLNHDPIYDTVLVVPADVQVDTLTVSQLRWKLRTDFKFRYDFAQYALSQPRSFDWNNRVLGNRYNVYNPYNGFGYSNYWSRDMMWNDWVWGYNSYSPHMWSPFGYDRWGYNSYGWNNYGWNNWGWNGYYGNGWGWRQQMNNYAWNNRNRSNTVRINGRRGYNNIQSRVVANNTNRTRVVTTKPIINNSNLVIKEDGVRWYSNNKPKVIINKQKPRINNSKPLFNNSKPVINNTRPVINNTRPRSNTSSRSSNNTTIRSNSRRKN
jgi:hypothetical protein